MAFPSDSGTNPQALDLAWNTARALAGRIKRLCTAVRAQSAAGPIGWSVIEDLLRQVADHRDALATIAALPGIGAWAQEQEANAGLNVTAEYNALVTQLNNVRDWVIANAPKDGSGYLLVTQLDANARPVDRQFSSASLAGFRTQLDGLIAAIN